MSAPIVVDLGPEICGSLDAGHRARVAGDQRPGWFCLRHGAGVLTRRYHGLLIAALPDGAELCWSPKFDEIIRYDGRDYALGANRWTSGSVEPQGFH